MANQAKGTIPAIVPPHAAELEPDAIGLAQDTLIGVATSGPAVTVTGSVAVLAAATAYAGPLVLILTAIPMLVVANVYRRLNQWNANCGASFEWVGRSISPYLGFITGWLMLAGTLIGTLFPVEALGPSVLAAFNVSSTDRLSNVLVDGGLVIVMTFLAVVGIKISAWAQVGMGVVEYVILIFFAVAGLLFALGHHPGSFPITSAWFTWGGIGGKGAMAAGFLTAVFMYSGWDGTVYVNEETRQRRMNPGRAAVIAVGLVGFFYVFSQIGLQGVVSPSKLQNNGSSALVYLGGVMHGSAGSQTAAFAVALSVVAATLAGILLTARIAYGMASYRVLPTFLANVSPRFNTPVAGTILAGLFLLVVSAISIYASSVGSAIGNVIDVTGWLYGSFYLLTVLAAIAYFRRRIFTRFGDALTVGILALGAVAFLGWAIWNSIAQAANAVRYSFAGVIVIGILLMFSARYIQRSPFFNLQLESASQDSEKSA
jgi:amino acid transporter